MLRLTGNGFLYNMIRIIVGTILKVGKGKLLPEDIPQIIASKDRTKAGPTAPPQGLCLDSIAYPEQPNPE
jgi:tRNA pseudouridine38-40 synthase